MDRPRVHVHITYTQIIHTEFKEERRILLEVIGPELQSIYDDRQIEVTDFHFVLFFSSPYYYIKFCFQPNFAKSTEIARGLFNISIPGGKYILYN